MSTFKYGKYAVKKEWSDGYAMKVIGLTDRSEGWENPRIYCKAIRACLIAQGFNEDWVETRFRDLLEGYYFNQN